MVIETPFDATKCADLHGEIVSWYTTSGAVSLHKIRESLAKAGLDPESARELNSRSVFGRATKHLQENRLIEKVSETDEGVVTFQLTETHIENTYGKAVMRHEYECQVTLDTRNGRITCVESPAIEARARELYLHHAKVRTSTDVTRLVQRLFRRNADLYPINPQKGVAYFVPEKHRAFTEQIDQFLQGVGGTICRFPVPKGTENGDASVREAVATGLSGVIKHLDECVENWDNSTRKSTMGKTIDAYQQAKFKVEAYAEYLGDVQAGLLVKLDETRKNLLERIETLQEAKQSTVES